MRWALCIVAACLVFLAGCANAPAAVTVAPTERAVTSAAPTPTETPTPAPETATPAPEPTATPDPWTADDIEAIARTLSGECYEDKPGDKRLVAEVILNRVSDGYQAMVADLYVQYAADIAAHGVDAQQVFDDYALRMTTFEQTAQADFQTWVATIQGILDAEAAGHLQNEIDALPNTFYTKAISDQRLAEAVAAHNTDPASHGDTSQRIANLETEVAELEIIIGPAIDTNPFTTTFTTLAGKVVTGVRNNTLGRIEF